MGSQMDDKVMYMNLEDVNRLMRDPKGSEQSLRLFLNDAFNYQAVVSALTDRVGVSVNNMKTWRERQGPLFDAVKMEKNMMTLMLLLIIAVAAFNIVSALVMVVTEKQGDIAVLQTQGMLPSSVMWIFVLNGLFNGIKGAGIGLVLGVVITLQLNNILDLIGSPLALAADGRGLPIEMDVVQIAGIALLSLLLCVLASVYPARKAMKIAPRKRSKTNKSLNLPCKLVQNSLYSRSFKFCPVRRHEQEFYHLAIASTGFLSPSGKGV